MKEFLTSSTGQGTKLRIKALALLLIPLLNELLKSTGFVLINEDVEGWIDGLFMTAFFITEGWGWVRAYWGIKKV